MLAPLQGGAIRGVGNQDYRWPTGRAIARSIGIGVDMKDNVCYKVYKIARATVRTKTRIPPRRSMSSPATEAARYQWSQFGLK